MRPLALLALLLASCTPQERVTVANDARNLEPAVYRTCHIVQTTVDVLDPAGAPIVDLACRAAEDIDGALATLASRGVTKVRMVYRVDCPMTDAGRE